MSQQDASSGYFQVHEPPLVGCHTMAPLCLTMKWGNRTIQITQLQRPCTESNGDPELSAVLYRWNNSYQDGAEIFLNEFQWLLLLDILAEDWYLALEATMMLVSFTKFSPLEDRAQKKEENFCSCDFHSIVKGSVKVSAPSLSPTNKLFSKPLISFGNCSTNYSSWFPLMFVKIWS